MRLLALKFTSDLHTPLGNNSFYKLDDDKLLEWNAVSQLQFTSRFALT